MTPLNLQWLAVWLKKVSEKCTHSYVLLDDVFFCTVWTNMLKTVLLCNNVQLRKMSPLFSLSQAWQPLLFSQIQCSPLCPLKIRMPPIQSQSHMKVRNHTQLVSFPGPTTFSSSQISCPLSSMSVSIYFYHCCIFFCRD